MRGLVNKANYQEGSRAQETMAVAADTVTAMIMIPAESCSAVSFPDADDAAVFFVAVVFAVVFTVVFAVVFAVAVAAVAFVDSVADRVIIDSCCWCCCW